LSRTGRVVVVDTVIAVVAVVDVVDVVDAVIAAVDVVEVVVGMISRRRLANNNWRKRRCSDLVVIRTSRNNQRTRSKHRHGRTSSLN
jgi:hypothetical protein